MHCKVSVKAKCAYFGTHWTTGADIHRSKYVNNIYNETIFIFNKQNHHMCNSHIFKLILKALCKVLTQVRLY